MSDTIFGRSLQEGRRRAVAFVASVPVNVATVLPLLALPSGGGKVRIESVEVTTSAALNDADGTILLNVLAFDASEGADDSIVASFSLEGLTAHAPTAATLAAEGAENERTLNEGDSLRATIVSNSAAIDTNGAVLVQVTYIPLPYTADVGVVRYESNY